MSQQAPEKSCSLFCQLRQHNREQEYILPFYIRYKSSKTLRTLSDWFLASLTGIYTGLFLLYQLAPLSPWAESHSLHLIQALDVALYVPLPLLALLLMLLKPRRALLLLCLPLAVFMLNYGQRFFPQVVVSGPRLRVMTWNILYSNDNMHGIVHAIEREQPDIIAIQELAKPQSYALSKTLEELYPYQLLKPSDDTSGLGIFSRFPITEGFPPKLSGPYCRCQHAFIGLASQKIEIINVHPHIPYIYTRYFGTVKLPTGLDIATQRDTFDELLKRMQLRQSPLLVLGDLNTTERQQPYAELRPYLNDAFHEAGWGLGLTYPQNYRLGRLPVPAFLRLDYIFYSPEWKAQAAWTYTAPGSDHTYVVADLVLPPVTPYSSRLTSGVRPFNRHEYIFAYDRDSIGGNTNTNWRYNSLTSAHTICPAMPGACHSISYQRPRRK